MNLKDRYAIVGIGYTPRGRIPDRTALSFYLEDEVVKISTDKGEVTGVKLSSGEDLNAKIVLN